MKQRRRRKKRRQIGRRRRKWNDWRGGGGIRWGRIGPGNRWSAVSSNPPLAQSLRKSTNSRRQNFRRCNKEFSGLWSKFHRLLLISFCFEPGNKRCCVGRYVLPCPLYMLVCRDVALYPFKNRPPYSTVCSAWPRPASPKHTDTSAATSIGVSVTLQVKTFVSYEVHCYVLRSLGRAAGTESR